MVAESEETGSPRLRLALWIFGPVLALAVVLAAGAGLPSYHCYGDEYEDPLPKELAATASAAMTFLVCGAGAWRWIDLRQSQGLPALALPLVVAAAAAIFGAWIAIGGLDDGVVPLVYLGAIATVVLFLGLLAALFVGLGPDRAGVFPPAYCFCAGAFLYPLLVRFYIAVSEGAFC